jgi:hypothetical protein
MSSSVRTKHAFATGLAVVLTGGGLAAVAAPAHATTGSVEYTCTDPLDPTKTFKLPVEIDSDAPAKIYVGDTANIKVSSKTVLPAALAKTVYDAPIGARFFDGSVAGNGTVKVGNGQPAPVVVNQVIPETPIPDQATATNVPFTATSASAIPFKPATLGDLEMSAGNFVATLNLKDAAKNPTVPPKVDVTCTAPAGKAPVIDTVVVAAKSSTALTLAPTTGGYGAPVTATAKVTTTAGTPDGDVTFVVDGVSTKVAVKDGAASLVIDEAVVGTHAVSATFTPKDAVHYDGSSAAPASLKVSKAATSTKVKITGKRVRERTAAAIKVVGINKTVPTGKVKLVLRKAGNQGFHKAKSGTLAKGARAFNLGRLGKGKYKVVVKYVGDANHLRSKTVKRFRVRR